MSEDQQVTETKKKRNRLTAESWAIENGIDPERLNTLVGSVRGSIASLAREARDAVAFQSKSDELRAEADRLHAEAQALIPAINQLAAIKARLLNIQTT